jgi:hypothetical protein
MILARAWNQLVARVRASRPIGGLGVDVTDTGTGALVSADPSASFAHPWQLSARWQEDEWRVFVRPGFVNGRDATISMRREKEKPKDVALTDEERPYLTPGWRNPLASAGLSATLDGDLFDLPAEGYPAFFKQLGVRDADGDSRNVAAFDATAAERTRELRACDIVLVTPRVATVQDVDIRDPLTEAQAVSISTRFVNAYAGSVESKYRLLTVSKWSPPQEPTAMDRFMGTAVEPQTDEIKIATLWMVSPPDPPDAQDAVPDGTWVAWPQYDVFWNLAHAPRRAVPARPTDPITLNTGLAFGIGDALFNALLSPVNDANAQIEAFLNDSTFKGEFWTV